MPGVTEWCKRNDNDERYYTTWWGFGAGWPHSIIKKKDDGWVIVRKKGVGGDEEFFKSMERYGKKDFKKSSHGYENVTFRTKEEAMLACDSDRAVYGTKKWEWRRNHPNGYSDSLTEEIVFQIIKYGFFASVIAGICLIVRCIVK